MNRPILAAALCLLAAACASPRQQAEDAIANPLERFALTAHPDADETRLAVHPGGLSPNQQAALAEAASRWRDTGAPVMVISVPEGAPQALDARMMAEQVRAILNQRGAPPDAVRLVGYDAKGDPAAPIIASFPSLRADIPACGLKWDNLSGTQSNSTHGNFGCAIAANMAAQIANPADIVAPRAMTPADASRRAVVTDNYRKGLPTGAQIDSASNGSVSKAIP